MCSQRQINSREWEEGEEGAGRGVMTTVEGKMLADQSTNNHDLYIFGIQRVSVTFMVSGRCLKNGRYGASVAVSHLGFFDIPRVPSSILCSYTFYSTNYTLLATYSTIMSFTDTLFDDYQMSIILSDIIEIIAR